MSDILISLRSVRKSYLRGGRVVDALKDIRLDIGRGERVVFIGPSGCGKSTVLNLIAGLIRPTSGEVLYGGKPLSGVNTRVGYMPQADGNIPWRTVGEDVAFPLEIRGVPRPRVRAAVAEMLRTVGLSGFENHYPSELSGGMRKRSVLARTLIYEPECLLMDEPFGALDAQTKLQMQMELQNILMKFERRTMVFVTHDLEEAVTLGDRVAVFSRRPGTIKLVHRVDLPWPRDVHAVRFTPAFKAHYDALWRALQEEIREAEVSLG